MLLDKHIKVKVSNRTKKYFLDKGYIDNSGWFSIYPKDMNSTNRTKVTCECDYCGKINTISWGNYIVQINKNNIYSCHKCHFNKTKIEYSKNHGVDNIQLLPSVRNKMKNTNIEKYGTECVFQSEVIKEKIKQTFLNRYGVDHPMKNREIFEKAQSSSYHRYKYKESELNYQGSYELDFIKHCEFLKLNIENGPSIKYNMSNKDRIYYSDFYIPEYNLICEVKSSYTMSDDYEENLAKSKYSLSAGYNFVFILDKNYLEFNSLLNKIKIL